VTTQSSSADPRLPLNRERVLSAAVGLADEAGLEALSMRRLGQRLGVEAMSLYNHVANKDDILSGIVDIVERGIEVPGPGAGWKQVLRTIAMSAHEVYERHPWAASLSLSTTGARPARWRYMDAVLGTLRTAGFTAEATDLAYHALESHVAGFTLWASQLQLDEKELADLAARFLEDFPGADYPHVVEHIHQHLLPRNPDSPGAFAFGLDLILDGLERIREAT
jgi:AcrR family transcriptional regulator